MENSLPARSNEADVTIFIQRAQLPIFISTPYSTTVLETARNNSQVFRVTATDADGQVKKFFKIYLKKIINPFPNKRFFLCVCSTSLLRTRLEKQKLLVKSNFSFSHSIFYLLGELSAILIKFRIVICKLFGRVENLSFGKG